MIQLIKQARAAFGLLNPEEVRRRAARQIHVGLVASTEQGYAEMEEFLVPRGMPRDQRIELMGYVHRAGDANVPSKVDLVLYQEGLEPAKGAFTFHPSDPDATVDAILHDKDELSLGLSRLFPPFRKAVVDDIIQSVAKENAMFVVATALPNVIPSAMELPWALGEFASDTAFLTGNQIRMAFLIGAACGSDIGLAAQKGAVLSIIASAFGWRAMARELAGKNPLGEGLIPKGAIAYAGTFDVGKAIQRFHNGNPLTRNEREQVYREALDHGRTVAGSFDVRS